MLQVFKANATFGKSFSKTVENTFEKNFEKTAGRKIDIGYNNRNLTVEDALIYPYAYITQIKSETNFL